MRNIITMEMSICQAENGFSLDELVKKVADSYEKKAFADILKIGYCAISRNLPTDVTGEVSLRQGKDNSSFLYSFCTAICHMNINGSIAFISGIIGKNMLLSGNGTVYIPGVTAICTCLQQNLRFTP